MRYFVGTVAPHVVIIREPIKRDGIEGEAYNANQLVVVRKTTGQIIAVIDRDNFYDRDGNRFTYS